MTTATGVYVVSWTYSGWPYRGTGELVYGTGPKRLTVEIRPGESQECTVIGEETS